MLSFKKFLALSALVSFNVMAAPKADLKVSFAPASPVKVYSSAAYAVKIENLGNANAASVQLKIQLPQTANSPGVFVFGNISGLDSRCSRAGILVTCQLGTINRNQSTLVAFNFAFPHAEKVLKLEANATTTTNEVTSANNIASLIPSLTYDAIQVGSGIVTKTLCSGTSTLSSFYECVLAPSSTQSYQATYLNDGSIDLGDPGTIGYWSQSSASDLHFEYWQNGQMVQYFNGKAVNANCFEGVGRFPNNLSRVAPMKVCL